MNWDQIKKAADDKSIYGWDLPDLLAARHELDRVATTFAGDKVGQARWESLYNLVRDLFEKRERDTADNRTASLKLEAIGVNREAVKVSKEANDISRQANTISRAANRLSWFAIGVSGLSLIVSALQVLWPRNNRSMEFPPAASVIQRTKTELRTPPANDVEATNAVTAKQLTNPPAQPAQQKQE